MRRLLATLNVVALTAGIAAAADESAFDAERAFSLAPEELPLPALDALLPRVETAPIAELRTDSRQRWAEKHWKSIELSYRRAPYFERYAEAVRRGLLKPYDTLQDACFGTLEPILKATQIATPMRSSSDLNIQERKSDLVLRLCERSGATTYISGPFGREYLDLPAFERAGIEVRFHDYIHPEYSQVYPGFEPYMAAIDLLFNCGPDTREIITRGQPQLALA